MGMRCVSGGTYVYSVITTECISMACRIIAVKIYHCHTFLCPSPTRQQDSAPTFFHLVVGDTTIWTSPTLSPSCHNILWIQVCESYPYMWQLCTPDCQWKIASELLIRDLRERERKKMHLSFLWAVAWPQRTWHSSWQGADVGYPFSPIVANYFMEVWEEKQRPSTHRMKLWKKNFKTWRKWSAF